MPYQCKQMTVVVAQVLSPASVILSELLTERLSPSPCRWPFRLPQSSFTVDFRRPDVDLHGVRSDAVRAERHTDPGRVTQRKARGRPLEVDLRHARRSEEHTSEL